jgi:hypothetical protein
MSLNLEEVFAKFEDDYIQFDRVENRTSKRPDLHAFMLLEKLLPGDGDLISAAEHDEFWLDIDLVRLAEVATEEDIQTLVRCGIRYDAEFDALAMFT